jgi:aldehyde:ferredoxin oxidoreductase
MVILEGKSPKPVYLHIENDKAELLPADDFIWGKSVWETEEAIKTRHQDPLMRVSCIGKAGENGVLFAAIVNDLHRAAGRSGVGTVMGSKNLKAVAVRGTKGVGGIRDPKAFMAATAAGKKVLADNPVTGQGLPKYGTQVLMNVINEMGASPTRNHQDVQFEGASKISGEAMHEKRSTDGQAHLVTNQACFGCTIACGRISKIDETHYSVKTRPEYWGANGGLEYEAAWAFGNANGVDDLEALQFCNLICNEQGMDPITLGSTVGAIMELYEMGALTKEEIGFEAPFGSTDALLKLVEMTANGEGFGKIVGLGSKRLTEKYGHPELSMSVKGQEFPAYDGRALQGMGLEYATSNRGACHLRGYMVSTEVLGIPFKTEPQATEGKPEILKAFQDATAVVDSAGICVFTTFAWGLPDIQPQIQAACEGDWSLDKLNLMGERIWNMEREFNLAAGFTAKDDTLPPRLLKEGCKTGPQKGAVARLDIMMPKYYEVRGWDTEGVPTAETKARLGL